MKKGIFAAVLLIAGFQTAWAQKMTVQMTNSQTYEFKIPEVLDITFTEEGTATKQFVDLGLPSGTLWATFNVGADKPEAYGDYFAWGETKSKTFYSWVTYQLCNGTEKTMNKYCANANYGTVDRLTTLKAEDDAATVNWGNDWQTPSKEQWQELLYGGVTTVEFTKLNEMDGMTVTSKINGKSIFLPAAGYINESTPGFAGTYGLYWSRTLNQNTSSGAYYMFFYLPSTFSATDDTYSSRYPGLSVRPVRRRVVLVTKIVIQQYLSLQVGESKTLAATVLPDDADKKTISWETSNSSVARVDQAGNVTAKGKGTCTITCRSTDGSNVSAQCEVTVGGKPTHGKLNNQEWVDLKLPSQTLWATRNIGANNMEEHGYYFAWGETTTKDEYNWHNYYFSHDGSSTQMTKYVTNSSYGTIDNMNLLEHDDDAASVLWGAQWQMPTEDQWRELINDKYTTSEWISVNGYEGIVFTSIANGESIFFPAAGYHNEEKTYDKGGVCHYWTRTLSKSDNTKATRFYKNSGTMAPQMNSQYGRNFGLPVRAVLVQGMIQANNMVTDITLSSSSLNLKINEAKTLTATVAPANADITDVTWESSDKDVAEVTQNGRVVGCGKGTCTITCRAADGGGVFAECQVTVGGNNINYEYVDLGLPSGTLWATCNVGANAPEEFGDYFAWGETTPKETYSWENYSLCNGSGTSIVKYCLRSAYGTVDNKAELEPEDDAATVNWGSEWQMPSPAQITELTNTDYTTSEMARVNGVLGKKVTSRANGNSIFLPFPGYYDESLLIAEDLGGYYWTRSLYDADETLPTAYYLSMSSDAFELCIYGGARYFGFPVRPVRKQ